VFVTTWVEMSSRGVATYNGYIGDGGRIVVAHALEDVAGDGDDQNLALPLENRSVGGAPGEAVRADHLGPVVVGQDADDDAVGGVARGAERHGAVRHLLHWVADVQIHRDAAW